MERTDFLALALEEVGKVLGGAETFCKWLYDVFTTESKVAMAYAKASLSA